MQVEMRGVHMPIMYLILGMIDLLVVLALLFQFFRWPFFRFWKGLFLIAGLGSFESYLMRLVWELPQWDIAVQGVTLLLGLWRLTKVRLHQALTLTVIGYLAFTTIQGLLIKALEAVGLIRMEIIFANIGMEVFFLQVVCQLTGFAVAYTLYKLRWGFSYVTFPVDPRQRPRCGGNHLAVILHVLGVLLVLSTMFLVIHLGSKGIDIVTYAGFPVLLGLIYLAYQEEIRV
jgi:hypothetical protein